MKTLKHRIFSKSQNLTDFVNLTKAEVVNISTISCFWNGAYHSLYYYQGELEADDWDGKCRYLDGDGFFYTKRTENE